MSEPIQSPAAQTKSSRFHPIRWLILVPLARLRFPIILAAITFVIVKWDDLTARFEQATGWKDSGGAATGHEFFCPMHPTIVRDDNKQKCPICNMPLSKRKKEAATEEAELPAGIVSRVQLSPYRVVLAGVKTTTVNYQTLAKDITTIGTVEFDERGLKKISARVKGRIDKLLVNETGHLVKKDEDLAELYSPELIVTVENLLNARKLNNAEAEQSARERLKLWGVDPRQIDKIIADNKPITHLMIRSPIAGHVLKKYPLEGQYVEEGSPLYDIADIKTVWVQAQLYEDDLAFLPKGTHDPKSGLVEKKLSVQAKARAFPGRTFEGVLSFVFPHLDQESRTLAIRFVLDNAEHELRPGMTTTVHLRLDAKSLADLPLGKQLKMQEGKILAIPERSIIDTGDRKIVFREVVPTQYEGVEVVLGPRLTGPGGDVYYPAIEGLKLDDQIVTSGSFLIDAETRLNPALGSIYIGGSGGNSGSAQVRPTTPNDDLVSFERAIKALPLRDQPLARAQRFCAYQQPNSSLGSMGAIQKIEVKGTPVFLCCRACVKPALADAENVLARAEALRKQHGHATKAPLK